MERPNSQSTITQPFCPVKSTLSSQLPLFPDSMIHHKGPPIHSRIIVSYSNMCKDRRYGVSRSQRVLPPQLLFKKYDLIRDFLTFTLGQTVAQREVTLRLLRLWAYYGKVYPKESSITELPGCSKATFWRTVKLLEESNLLQVINRYVIRPHAQISNLYRFDKLLIVIARYLAEHGVAFLEKWLEPYLQLPGRVFWGSLAPCQESRAGLCGSGSSLCVTS